MKAIVLPAPHGFLIWRGKQAAIGSNQALPIDERIALVSNGEAYGELVLGQPSVMVASEFDRLGEKHCIRPEERKLWWNGSEEFFVHPIKEFESYQRMKACQVEDGELILLNGVEPDEECKALLVKAEKLPKIIVLRENVISLEGNKVKKEVDVNILPVIGVTFDEFDLGDKALPIYHLALVKVPNMRFREKQEDVMPYKKVRRDGQWCVVKTTDGTTEKCYDNEGEADDFLTALVLNVDKKKEDEVMEDEKATWTAKYVNDLPNSSFLYIEPGGEEDEDGRTVPRTLRHFPYKDADGNIDLPHLRNALARIPQSSLSDTLKERLTNEATRILERQDKKAGKRMAGRMLERLKEAWQTMKDLLTWAEYDDEEMKAIGIKEVQGRYWFFAHSTNAFQDREAEIFSTKSLEQYVSESEKQDDRGYFNFWHIPGSDFARKEWQGVVGRVLVEAGPFLDNDIGQKALEFFKQYPSGHIEIAPEGWGCSPEYRYLPEERKSGVYQNIWITRTSTLPRLAAANIWTKGGIMALSEQQLKAAQAVFGEELASQIIANAERQTKELEEAGVAHKSTEEQPTNEHVEEVKVAKPVEPVKTEVKAEDTAKQEMTEDMPDEPKPDEGKPDFGEMIAKSMQPMMEGMAMMAGRMDEMMARLDKLEGSEKMKMSNETPRWLAGVYERASQSNKTALAEDDPLKDKKPVETAPTKKGADAFFSSRQ